MGKFQCKARLAIIDFASVTTKIIRQGEGTVDDKQAIWSEVSSLLQSFSPFYREGMLRHVQAHDAPDNWFTLGPVRALEPESFRLAQAREMFPYIAPGRQQERYKALVDEGCLEGTAVDGFRLTDRGRAVIEGFFTTAHKELVAVKPLPEEESAELLDLLNRLTMAAMTADEPADKLSLTSSRWTDPGPDSALSARIDQYVTDLYSFRDDAHMGAWKPLEVDGQTWEALTTVWREEASTAGELAEQLAFRGYNADDYAAALLSLAERGWVEEQDGQYRVTDTGKKVREDAEDETNRLFFGPWSSLSASELDRLHTLSKKANENLAKASLEQFWGLASAVAQGINSITRSVVDEPFQERFEKPGTFFPILMALGNRPEPMTIEAYRRRFPYNSPGAAASRLEDATEAGHLQAIDGGYAITEKGITDLAEVNDVFYSYLGEIEALGDEDMAAVADLLSRVVQASLEADEPADKWAIENMHACHIETAYAPLARVDQHVDDLNAFRDDAHRAAWQPYGVKARTWETLTLIWREDAASSAELAEQLSTYRGYDEEAYALSLAELADRGWIAHTNGGFVVTAEGRRVRQEAEETTNRVFYGPWLSLESQELFRLRDVLIRLKLRLENLANEEGPPDDD